MGAQFRILTVCTGNVCRSPLAAQLLHVKLKDLPFITVESAGTRALEGQPMPIETQQVARELGVADPEQHRARQLTEQMLDDADLVLAMTREHRRLIVELNPRAARRTLTIRELARYAAVVTDEDIQSELAPSQLGQEAMLKAAVRGLAIGRALAPSRSVDADDVTDPYGQPLEIHQHTGAELGPAVDTTASYVRRAIALAGVN